MSEPTTTQAVPNLSLSQVVSREILTLGPILIVVSIEKDIPAGGRYTEVPPLGGFHIELPEGDPRVNVQNVRRLVHEATQTLLDEWEAGNA